MLLVLSALGEKFFVKCVKRCFEKRRGVVALIPEPVDAFFFLVPLSSDIRDSSIRQSGILLNGFILVPLSRP